MYTGGRQSWTSNLYGAGTQVTRVLLVFVRISRWVLANLLCNLKPLSHGSQRFS